MIIVIIIIIYKSWIIFCYHQETHKEKSGSKTPLRKKQKNPTVISPSNLLSVLFFVIFLIFLTPARNFHWHATQVSFSFHKTIKRKNKINYTCFYFSVILFRFILTSSFATPKDIGCVTTKKGRMPAIKNICMEFSVEQSTLLRYKEKS